MVRMPVIQAGVERFHLNGKKGSKWMKESRTIPSLTTVASSVGWSLEIGAGR
jgi:hypothetical protein